MNFQFFGVRISSSSIINSFGLIAIFSFGCSQIYAQTVINDNLLLRVSGATPYLAFQHQANATIPFYQWTLETAQAEFRLHSNSFTPVRVSSSAPSDSLFVSETGAVGIGTIPSLGELHLKSRTSTVGLYLESSPPVGTRASKWLFECNQSGMFIDDNVTGNIGVFSVLGDCPSGTLSVAPTGVGVGTLQPSVIGTTLLPGTGKNHRVEARVGTARSIVEGASAAESYLVHSGGAINRKVVRTRIAANRYLISSITDNLATTVDHAISIDLTTMNVGVKTANPTKPLQVGDTGANDGNGAHCTNGGVWTNASSRSIKQDIEPLTSKQALNTVRSLQPVEYRYKNEPDERYVGFIAEDVPELVATKDRKSLSPMDITAVLTRVVQDQNRDLEEQKRINAELKERLLRIEKHLSRLNVVVEFKDHE